jgi:hypothetical protein
MCVDSLADSTTSVAVDLKGNLEESMRHPLYILRDQFSRNDGTGPVVDLNSRCGKLLVATLGIDHVAEHGGLVVSIWASPDGTDWGTKPLVSFPPKYYCGLYSLLLNLAARPEIRYLRPQWSMKAWGKTSAPPVFSFRLFVEESGARLSTAVA